MSVYNSQTLLMIKEAMIALNQLERVAKTSKEVDFYEAERTRLKSTIEKLTATLGELPFDDETILNFNEPRLQVPPRIFTADELASDYNGKNGHPAYVAVSGYVFNVTNTVFQKPPHQVFEAGQDLTVSFTTCHANDIYMLAQVAPVMGRFIR